MNERSKDYDAGWQDVVSLMLRQFSGIRDNYLMPKGKREQERLEQLNAVLHLLEEYRDIEMKLAQEEDRLRALADGKIPVKDGEDVMNERQTIRAALRRLYRYRGSLRSNLCGVGAVIDPEYRGKVAVRLTLCSGGVEDYLVDTQDPRPSWQVEEVEWLSWPPTRAEGGPRSLADYTITFTSN